MHPNILHLVTATLHAARYGKQYSPPLKNAPFTYENHSENVGNINTERPLEKTGLNYSEGAMLPKAPGPHFSTWA